MVFTVSRPSEHTVLGGSESDNHEPVFLLKQRVSAGQAVVSHAEWADYCCIAIFQLHVFSLRILHFFIAAFFFLLNP